MNKFFQSKKSLLIVVLGALALVVAIFFWFIFSQTKSTFTLPRQISITKPAQEKIQVQPKNVLGEEAILTLSPQTTAVVLGKEVPLEIKLKANKLLISGVAVRLVYEFNQNPPLKPQDIKMEVNPLFLENNWVYPVNKVWIDWENNKVIGELAAVNLSPTGFLASEETIATINFTAQSQVRNVTLDFDPEQTKVTSKKGGLINLVLEKGEYTID